jgi:peptidoglycan-N-acetylglucosamine deacetylase
LLGGLVIKRKSRRAGALGGVLAQLGAPTKSRRLRRWPWILGALAAVMAIAVGVSSAGMFQLAWPSLLTRGDTSLAQSTATATPTVTPTPSPTATATPPPGNTVHNIATGCFTRAPAPLPYVVYTGTYVASPAPTPREVAITFDDGPTPYSTPAILSYLERTGTPATFFVEGSYVHTWPYLLRREWQDGFAVGVHTWDHPQMTRLTQAQMQQQIGDTIQAIHTTLGQDSCLWFWRPPYGEYNDQVVRTARANGLSTIMWDVDPRDWSRPGAAVIAQSVLAQTHAGAIILLHDGPALREQTAAALPAILAGLKARGLVPVTLPRLLADGRYPGVFVLGSLPHAWGRLAAPLGEADLPRQ